jgi:hypothetical protein
MQAVRKLERKIDVRLRSVTIRGAARRYPSVR